MPQANLDGNFFWVEVNLHNLGRNLGIGGSLKDKNSGRDHSLRNISTTGIKRQHLKRMIRDTVMYGVPDSKVDSRTVIELQPLPITLHKE